MSEFNPYNDELYHWAKGDTKTGAKYVARKWVNGKWQYVYSRLGQAKKKVSSEINKTKKKTKKDAKSFIRSNGSKTIKGNSALVFDNMNVGKNGYKIKPKPNKTYSEDARNTGRPSKSGGWTISDRALDEGFDRYIIDKKTGDKKFNAAYLQDQVKKDKKYIKNRTK